MQKCQIRKQAWQASKSVSIPKRLSQKKNRPGTFFFFFSPMTQSPLPPLGRFPDSPSRAAGGVALVRISTGVLMPLFGPLGGEGSHERHPRRCRQGKPTRRNEPIRQSLLRCASRAGKRSLHLPLTKSSGLCARIFLFSRHDKKLIHLASPNGAHTERVLYGVYGDKLFFTK